MHHKQQPVSITSAPESLAADQARRSRAYLIQMGIRIVCIIGAILIPGPARWVMVAAAVVLPYIAVINVNMGRSNSANMGAPMEYYELEAAHDRATNAPAPEQDSDQPESPASQDPDIPGPTPKEPTS